MVKIIMVYERFVQVRNRGDDVQTHFELFLDNNEREIDLDLIRVNQPELVDHHLQGLEQQRKVFIATLDKVYFDLGGVQKRKMVLFHLKSQLHALKTSVAQNYKHYLTLKSEGSEQASALYYYSAQYYHEIYAIVLALSEQHHLTLENSRDDFIRNNLPTLQHHLKIFSLPAEEPTAEEDDSPIRSHQTAKALMQQRQILRAMEIHLKLAYPDVASSVYASELYSIIDLYITRDVLDKWYKYDQKETTATILFAIASVLEMTPTLFQHEHKEWISLLYDHLIVIFCIWFGGKVTLDVLTPNSANLKDMLVQIHDIMYPDKVEKAKKLWLESIAKI